MSPAPAPSAEIVGAALQLRRLLDLVPRVADGEPRPLAELARLAGVDARTILKDLRDLSSRFDAPGGFVDGLEIRLEGAEAGMQVEVQARHFRRPMRLTRAELRALELGLAVLGAERPAEERPAIARARARLRETLAAVDPREDAAALDAELAGGGVAPEGVAPLDERGRALLAVLRDARLARRKVRLAYRKPAAHAASARVACPYALVAAHGVWYLVGFCETGHGLRVFRLDRIEEAAATDEPFTIPPDFRVEQVLRDGRVFHAEGEADVLVVRYAPAVARWIRERERGREEPDGAFVVESPLADDAWAVRHVLQYGPEAEVLAPARVRSAVAAALDAMLAGALEADGAGSP